ncbi:MAG TPA: TIM barrel protein [Opitutales bacterium]|nr:TIM barrel protein [Opitutales bacterium]
MRIGISNLAWDRPEDEAVAALLNRYQVDAIEAVPTKYFPQPQQATTAEIEQVRAWWAAQGIEITSMQTLLYGTTGLNLFGPQDVQEAMLSYLKGICRIAQGLGATRLVFGSPKNRDRTGLSESQAEATAIDFFRKLGDIGASHNVLFCLEPNPPAYSCNFMIDNPSTARIVELVGHPAIRMQLDTGALTMNQESPAQIIPQYASLIGHIHASEPNLTPVGSGQTDHATIAPLVTQWLPDHLVSIEMLATKEVPHLTSIEQAIQTVRSHYHNPHTLL